MEDPEVEKQSLSSQVSEWDSVSITGQSPYFDTRLPQFEIDRSSPIPANFPSRNDKHKQYSNSFVDLRQQFLSVPSRGTGSGRASPSVAGSLQSDPESCMDTSRYQNDDSDPEVIG